MRKLTSIATIASLASFPALADPVVFGPLDAAAGHADIVLDLLERESVDNVETALIDVNNDGNAEIAVRLTDGCTAELCRTAVLRFVIDDWRIVFDRSASELEIGAAGFGGTRNLVTDQMTWTWNGERYVASLSASGTPVELSLAPADYVELLAYQFGEGALNLFRANQDVVVRIGSVNLNGSESGQLLVRLEGPGVCGRVLGCPWRILDVVDNAYVTLLEGTGSGDVVMLPVSRDGWMDMASTMPGGGFSTYGWSGEAYGMTELVLGDVK